MNQNDKFHGIAPELSDDELDSVSGGVSYIGEEDLKAFWAVGGQGVPICEQPHHGSKQVAMKSYRKNGRLHLECTECGFIKVI